MLLQDELTPHAAPRASERQSNMSTTSTTSIAIRIGDKDTGVRHAVPVSLKYAANTTFAHAAFRAADSDQQDIDGDDRRALRDAARDALRDERDEARALLRDALSNKDGESAEAHAVRRAATLRVALRGSRIG